MLNLDIKQLIRGEKGMVCLFRVIIVLTERKRCWISDFRRIFWILKG